MLDFFNFHFPTKSDVKIFTNNGPSTFETEYLVPRGKSMLFIYALAAGGGAGGGFTRIAGSAGGGGGGGASGSVSKLFVPIHLLPDRLFILVPNKPNGGSAGGTGTSGQAAYVSVSSSFTATNILLYSGTGGQQGQGGSGAGGGTGGVAGTAAVAGDMPLAGLGLWTSIQGQAGTNGGATTGGSQISFPTTGLNVMGGAGGAGTQSADFAGGDILNAGSWISEQRPSAPAAGSNNGSGGYFLLNNFWHYPGLGGSSSNTSIGGNGGNGSFGCGGGGGGAGTTGGRGGDGGAGLVIIIAW